MALGARALERKNMFRGINFHNIDPKGRVSVPAKFREIARADGSNGFMVTRMDGCLLGYSFSEWLRLEQRVLETPIKDDFFRRFRRTFVGGASECPFDRQGRILLPPPQRIYAAIEKEVVFVGVTDHFEIWSREKWDEENEKMEKDLKQEDARNQIAALGI